MESVSARATAGEQQALVTTEARLEEAAGLTPFREALAGRWLAPLRMG